ncbi:urate hydroxylase PuuD [Hymenobacter sp. J193]|uniref:urate hydroxylase PuuD n=1 Tax=Hymenobacter sp. J193 TaxID=2898429 RepID=UPI002151AD71|nr:urate hydroxylase PuuD [Hymenobacter sp. J193]MCR5887148.1 urate hydroxylase PuuD [Hymenobacter sp. J193]
MMHVVVLLVVAVVFFLILGASCVLHRVARTHRHGGALGEGGLTMQGFGYALTVLAVLFLLLVFYLLVQGTPWEGHLMEWLNIVVRLVHVTFGIAWIGASFYFVFLENALNRTDNVREELAGNLWAVHGGGFYYLEKYKLAPPRIPKALHWFKYEAYFTWLTGFSLLCVVYYFNAGAMLIDPQVLVISPLAGVAIGVGSFVVAWVLYHVLCRTPLVKNGLAMAVLGFLICTAFAWFYCQVFSARAAYLHFGAMLGTLMVGNVFFIIIPAQKAMVKAATEGQPLNPELGKHAGLRSLHNNYFTLPVLFVMISNHFPSTFGHSYPWAVLAAIALGTAGIKHWLNLREKHQATGLVFPLAAGLLLAVAFVTAPKTEAGAAAACTPNVGVAQVQGIVQLRCVRCHSATPTDEVFTTAPNGVVFDTPADIARLQDKVMQRVVVTKTMPQNNKTHMTQEERDLIRCWIEQGAKLE